jgi:hypothetical protein
MGDEMEVKRKESISKRNSSKEILQVFHSISHDTVRVAEYWKNEVSISVSWRLNTL